MRRLGRAVAVSAISVAMVWAGSHAGLVVVALATLSCALATQVWTLTVGKPEEKQAD